MAQAKYSIFQVFAVYCPPNVKSPYKINFVLHDETKAKAKINDTPYKIFNVIRWINVPVSAHSPMDHVTRIEPSIWSRRSSTVQAGSLDIEEVVECAGGLLPRKLNDPASMP